MTKSIESQPELVKVAFALIPVVQPDLIYLLYSSPWLSYALPYLGPTTDPSLIELDGVLF